MEEIEVGEYVRTNDGIIAKLVRIERDDIDTSLKWYVLSNEHYINKPYIVKHSKNVIDLIEVGDYVNGKLISNIDKVDNKNFIEWEDGEIYSTEIENDNFIKSVVTKQQFESIKYKI